MNRTPLAHVLRAAVDAALVDPDTLRDRARTLPVIGAVRRRVIAVIDQLAR